MKILYKNKKVERAFEELRDVSNDKASLKKYISFDILRMIKKRVDQLIAYPNFYCIVRSPIGKCEKLVGNLEGKYSIHTNANYRLIIMPNSTDLSKASLEKCEEFYIEGVVDYHGTKNKWIIS